MAIEVLVETGKRKTFASALDWPGWSRSARDIDGALEALADYADRFRPVAERAGLRLPKRIDLVVAEQVAGDATTDFGVPSAVAAADRRAVTAKAGERQAALVEAAWAAVADVAAAAPATLRKGPRGGGRDRDDIVRHVAEAEKAYASKMGLKASTVPDLRAVLLDLLRSSNDGSPLRAKGWPSRYAARRIAWHALDHAWEIEDKSDVR